MKSDRPYHHGDLRNALIRIGLELASEGGTAAVGLREASRRAGVSPSAAYRHFSSKAELLDAVRDQVLQSLTEALQVGLNAVEGEDLGTRLTAASRAYFSFAVNEPQQFHALASAFPLASDWPTSTGRPLKIITELAQAIEPPVKNPMDTALTIWATIHGASSLCTIGSLRELPIERKWDILESTNAVLVKGLGLTS